MMRKKNRFSIIAVLVLAAIGAIVWASTNWAKEPNLGVAQFAANSTHYVGDQVKVTGYVNVAKPAVREGDAIHFWISDQKGHDPVPAVYVGAAPDNFGKSAKAMVSGQVEKDGSINASMVETYCPDHYAAKNQNNNKIN